MPTRSRPIFLCGGDTRPGPRETDCPNRLHDYPLPSGYVDASFEATRCLNNRWSNRRCPTCHLYGWEPGESVTPTRPAPVETTEETTCD